VEANRHRAFGRKRVKSLNPDEAVLKRFAFVIHPIEAQDVTRVMPILRFAPSWFIEALLGMKSPSVVSEITGIRSITGEETHGWFIGLPRTPQMLVKEGKLEESYAMIQRCCELGAAQGADIIGLGAFSSVVGDGGITIACKSPIAVTTGNSYTVSTAIQAALKAADMLELDLSRSVLAVVGAAGSIGRTCAEVLAPRFAQTLLLGRDVEKLREVEAAIPGSQAISDPAELRHADVVISVSSAGREIVFPEHLAPGAIVVDVARPRDVSKRVARERPDVLVIEGGVVHVPGDVEFNFNFGFPPKTAYACMSETMMLALEGRIENFTLGKTVSAQQVQEIDAIADRHGFYLSGFRSFEREVGPEAIERAKRARASRKVPAALSEHVRS